MSIAPQFRPAAEADWPAIASLLEAGGLPLDGARAHLETFIVGAVNDELVCVAGYERYGSIALLRSVAVSSTLRGQGFGDRLLEAIRSKACADGVRTLYLLTTTAADFFGKRGFARIERASAPGALAASREFQGACPASATFMTSHIQA